MADQRHYGKRRSLCWLLGTCIFMATMLVYPVHWSPQMRLARTGFESVELGNSIALKGNFSDPFLPLPTGSSAHVAPGYPALVALIIKLFGVGPNGVFALGWLTKIVLAVQLSLLPFLADYLGLHSLTGAIAAVAWLIAQFPLQLWENDFAGLAIVVLGFPMYKAFRQQLSNSLLVYTGIVWGLLLLLTPTPMLVLCLWLISLILASVQSKRQIAILCVIPALIILPWLARNYHVFHRPVFLRDNLGLELAVSNNACAEFSFALNHKSGKCFANNHPNENFREALRLGIIGEPEYNQLRLHEAGTWINHNRARFLALTAQRFTAFWLPNSSGNPLRPGPSSRREWIMIVLTLLSIPGLLLVWRNNRHAAVLFGLWLVCFPPAYYLIQFDPRYRHPILWATFLPGSYIFTTLFSVVAGKSVFSRNTRSDAAVKGRTITPRDRGRLCLLINYQVQEIKEDHKCQILSKGR